MEKNAAQMHQQMEKNADQRHLEIVELLNKGFGS
jgi:hypothetical protein